MYKKIGITILASVFGSSVFAASMKEIENRLEDVELSRDLNIFEFGGELETRYDSTSSETKNVSSGVKTSGSSNDQYSMFFRLNMSAKPSDKFTFFGRLSMSKKFNDFIQRDVSADVKPSTGSSAAGRDKSGSTLFVERAFVNYSIKDNLIFSFGRLPTVEGPAYHLTRGTARSGTYPLLAYGSFLDGFALTHTTKIFGGSLASRIVYTPLNFYNLKVDSSIQDQAGNKVDGNLPMYAAMLDYEKVRLPWAQRFNIIAQYISLNDLLVDYNSNSKTQGATPQSDLVFSYSAFVIAAEVNRIAGTGLDLGLTYKTTKVESSGTQINGFNLGVFTDKDKDEKKGNVVLATARYSFLESYSFGAEYIKASKTAYGVSGTAIDPLGFYATNGASGVHLLFTKKFDNNLRTIVGYMKQDVDYKTASGVGSTIGSVASADVSRKAAYASIVANF